MKKSITLILLSFLQLYVYANYSIPEEIPTPNVASFGKYGIVPVSLYTGVPTISIPLYTFEYKGFSLPVTLNYDASGVNVNELPGWIGHNWTVNAGGTITRSVRGGFDEYNTHIPDRFDSFETARSSGNYRCSVTNYPNYFGSYDSVSNVNKTLDGVEIATLTGMYDLSPDIFYFNFLDYSGCFFLGHDGQWKVQSKNNLDIIFDISDSNNYVLPFLKKYVNGDFMDKTIKGFTIRDDKGYSYVFGGTTNAIDYTTPFFDMGQWDAISWHLTSILDKFGHEIYTFEYERGKYIVQIHEYDEQYKKEYTIDRGWGGQISESDSINGATYKCSINFNSPVYLKQIRSNNGVVGVFESCDNEDKDELGNEYMSFRRLYQRFSSWYYDSSFDHYNRLNYETHERNLYSYNHFRMMDYNFFYLLDYDLYTSYSLTNKLGSEYLAELRNYQYNPKSNLALNILSSEKDIFDRTRLRKLNCIYFTEETESKNDKYKGIGYQFQYSYDGRMHLDKIVISNAEDVKNAEAIRANGEIVKFDTISTYKFRYNQFEKLPEDYLTTSDAWGYYNGESKLKMWESGYRESNPDFAKLGSLKEIQYPTGGTTEFEYELNQYGRYLSDDKKTIIDCENRNGGGLRIASITNWESPLHDKILSKKTYSYTIPSSGLSSGIITNVPKFEWTHWQGSLTYFDGKGGLESLNPKGNATYTIRRNGAIIPLVNSFGPNLAYSCVTETNLDGSYSINWFSNISDPNLRDERFFRDFDNKEGNASPFDIYSSDKSFMRGNLLLSCLYDSHGKKVKSTKYVYRAPSELDDKYEILNSFEYKVRNIDIISYEGNAYLSDDANCRDVIATPVSTCLITGGLYKAFYSRIDLEREIDTIFESNGKIITNIIYENKDYTLGMNTPYKHNTDIRVTSSMLKSNFSRRYKVVYDYTITSDSILYKDYFNIIPTSIETYLNSVHAKTTKTSYKKDKYGHYLPSMELERIGANDTFKSKIIYNSYNGFGYLEEYQKNGITVTQRWDGHGRIRQRYKGQLKQNTAYTYDNLFGLTQITYQNRAMHSFEYDMIGLLIRENAFNLPKVEYDYSYRSSVGNGMIPSVQSKNQNYVQTKTFLTKDKKSHIVSIQYFDGIGRPVQVVENGKNTNGIFVHSCDEYDYSGNIARSWVPIAGDVSAEFYSPDKLLQVSSSQFPDEKNCYKAMTYDVLGRMKIVRKPGKNWENKYLKYRYMTNKSNDVQKYVFNNGKVTQQGYWLMGSLSCVQTEDEDHKISEKFTDFLGNIVLERVGENICTYYVYDEIGQLRVVLSPEYQCNPDLAKYAYQYTYDEHGRLSKKTLPGCAAIEYSYNDNDQVIRMQDGILAHVGKSRVFEYDEIGRMIRQSIATGEQVEYDEIVNYYDDDTFLNALSIPTYEPVNERLKSKYKRDYLLGTKQRASNGEELLTTYAYDEYGRVRTKGEIGLDKRLSITDYTYNFVGDVTSETTEVFEYDRQEKIYEPIFKATLTNNYDTLHTNLLMSSLLTVWDDYSGNTMTDTIQKLTYDDFGNIVHIDRGGTAADMSYEYDLLHGWVKSIQTAGGFSQTLKREAGGLYNGSIASMSWMMPNDMVERTYHYTYDGLNRLTNSEYGESAYATPSDDVVCPGDDESIPALGISALHQLIPQSMLSLNDEAGISAQSAGGYRGNPFDDDEMIVEEEPMFENKYGESVTYDKNSNITTLKRCGMLNNRTYGLIDDLTIEYNGNQRKKVTDAVTEHLTYDGASDFEDNSSASTQYQYHPNGTIKRDLNRRLVNNILDDQGHTKALNFSGNKYIYYVYAADGTKLRVSHQSPVFATGSNVVLYWLCDTTEYCGNLTLKNGHLHMYQFPGGYASFDGDTLSGWHYYVQDYQGNNRMVVNKDNTIEQMTHYYPYGGVIGDLSTNENLQAYKFEGKELDRNFGLDWYDVHARQYDAIVPWFTSIDQLAEKYYGVSPYAYCAGNPVNCVDLHGDSITIMGDIFEFLKMLINTLPAGVNFKLEMENGVINPNSIPDSDDSFLADFKYVASHQEMVEFSFADGYSYRDKNNAITFMEFGTPQDIDDRTLMNENQINALKACGVEIGKSMVGNTGVSLFSRGNANGIRPLGSRNQLVVNRNGNLNHQSIGFAHELIHFAGYFRGVPYSHPQIDNYLYPRMNTLIHRLGYDY